MSKRECDRLWEIDALREGRLGPKDADAAERHIAVCEACAAARSRDEELNAWLADAAPREPSTLELRRLRVRLLRSVGVDKPTGARHLGMRVALASALIFSVVLGGTLAHRHFAVKNPVVAIAAAPAVAPSATVVREIQNFSATVQASDGARWTQTRDGSIEHVQLDDGALSIHVRHRNEREQLFINLPDGTIEDRGTTFDVEAHDGHTTRVAVSEGVVTLRIRGANEILLRAGSSWPLPLTTPAARAPAVAIAASHASTSAAPDDDGSASYAAAVSLLRHRSYAAAATAFGDYVRAHPREPDAEDASYLEAVALAQSGDANGAMTTAERHLSSYPSSFHRKEASLLIGRLARDGGDCAKARKVLGPWLGDNADPDAVATLRTCP